MMKKRKRANSCSNMVLGFDRISELPNEIIAKILSSLPFKQGVRTSVLSTKWRYKWAMLPHLVFDDRLPDTIVDRVILSHIGPISKFQLSRRSRDIGDMDGWILPISRHPIKEFILELSLAQPYNMPQCMFSCQEMIHLHLSGCVLKPPTTFKGFMSLKSLHLEHVTLAQDAVEHMIVSCPLLEKLTLHDCSGFRQLKIDAPDLRFLRYFGSWDELSLVHTENLDFVSICKYSQLVARSCSSNLLKCIVNLPKVETLHVHGWFLKYLAAGPLLKELPKPCLCLKVLEMSIYFEEVEPVSTAICLLRSSPALETLELDFKVFDFDADVRAVDSWLKNYQSCSFAQLRHVTITNICGAEVEVNFIKFLLISSPVLRKISVLPWQDDPYSGDEILPPSIDKVWELRRFRPDVKIGYLKY